MTAFNIIFGVAVFIGVIAIVYYQMKNND